MELRSLIKNAIAAFTSFRRIQQFRPGTPKRKRGAPQRDIAFYKTQPHYLCSARKTRRALRKFG